MQEKINYPWMGKKYPIEKAIEKFFLSLKSLIDSLSLYLKTKPKSNFEKMLKAIEITIWLLLTYDLFKPLILKFFP